MRSIFERHDRYTFEAKINYILDTRQPKNKYFLTFYFFIPKQLNLTRKSYSRTDFYADTHTYIRFRNPRFTLEELLDKYNPRSPLCRIAANINDLRQNPSSPEINHKIIYELRMFGTIFKAFLKTQVINFIKTIRQEPKTAAKDLDRELDKFIAGLRELLRQSENLGKDIDLPNISRELQETRNFARDLLSLEVQNHLTLLLEVYRKKYRKASKKTMDSLIALIEAHLFFRKSRNSHLIRDSETMNENFTYWEGILKKYFQGVLYLTIQDRDTAGKAQHLFYAVAAGVAMFLSVMLGYWIGTRFTSEQSTSFIIAIVVAYMIKDRAKDIIRAYSNTLLGRLFPDHSFVIKDQLTKKNIGTVKESMHFILPQDIPEQVMQERSSGHMTRTEEEGKPEDVLVYQKSVTLDTRKISRWHTRQRDIDEIIRFNVRKMVQYADDSFHFDTVWDPRIKKTKKIKCAKVYHLNLIIRLETLADQSRRKLPLSVNQEKKQIIFKHVRVILNQDGIARMAEV
ncbi:MAG: hypothetical protein LBK44_02135 [Spirochaetales bacterium]|jgi:hypothetical protein|nr:hypothetical protein [Spirochaetales bacterium]